MRRKGLPAGAGEWTSATPEFHSLQPWHYFSFLRKSCAAHNMPMPLGLVHLVLTRTGTCTPPPIGIDMAALSSSATASVGALPVVVAVASALAAVADVVGVPAGSAPVRSLMLPERAPPVQQGPQA